ncbi:MAG: four helix bundle protein [Saprospiraceae bacterium]|nr:four helix bundle protein [Saprospiraceae bacterium]
MKAHDIEERLISISCKVLQITESMPKKPAAKHLGNQIIRSATSPALNYGEAQAAESREDFIHKMKICLKELRETYVCLKIISSMNFVSGENLFSLLQENNELISIFVKSLKTASIKNTQ